MSIPQQQHYVPRFLLKNFSSGKKPQVYVYDKSTDNEFRTHIKNVAAEKAFYDIDIDGDRYSLEPSFHRLESNAAGIVRRLNSTKTLAVLDVHARAVLACLLAVQFVRTRQHRLMFEHATQQLAGKLRGMGATEENVQELIGSDGVDAAKLFGVHAVLESRRFIPHFLDKEWLLFETSRRDPFLLSDHPIVLHNGTDQAPYGNLGLACKGIEIYLPLSTSLCLGMLCPSIGEQFRRAYENFEVLDRLAPGLASATMSRPIGTRLICEGLVTGRAVPAAAENVMFLNSLQVIHSSRFVFCEIQRFDLVKRMIADSPKRRSGLLPVVS